MMVRRIEAMSTVDAIGRSRLASSVARWHAGMLQGFTREERRPGPCGSLEPMIEAVGQARVQIAADGSGACGGLRSEDSAGAQSKRETVVARGFRLYRWWRCAEKGVVNAWPKVEWRCKPKTW